MNIVMASAALREIILGLWKVHILQHASEGGVVGNHLLQELRSHGYDVSPGTLYPLLHRMERNGWLSASDERGAHTSRVYSLTPDGAEVLALARGFVDELHRELAEHEAISNPPSGTRAACDAPRQEEPVKQSKESPCDPQ